jgi:hypothetical protein
MVLREHLGDPRAPPAPRRPYSYFVKDHDRLYEQSQTKEQHAAASEAARETGKLLHCRVRWKGGIC